MTDSPKPKRRENRPSHVRFSQKQFDRIQRDALRKGKSIPSLLRAKYFKGPRPLPLMTTDDLEWHFSVLRHIQERSDIAVSKLTGAIWGDTTDDLQAIQAMMQSLWDFLTAKYCRCNPKRRPAM